MSIRMGRTDRALFHIAWAVSLSMLLVASWAQDAPQAVVKRKIPCKTQENAAICYWARGRLSVYNGTPSYRLWKIGTHRILGIHSGPGANDPLDNEHPELPANVKRVFKPFSNQIFADFEICPLEPEETGTMQSACIESAKNIVLAK